jgi:hypothetical protein
MGQITVTLIVNLESLFRTEDSLEKSADLAEESGFPLRAWD